MSWSLDTFRWYSREWKIDRTFVRTFRMLRVKSEKCFVDIWEIWASWIHDAIFVILCMEKTRLIWSSGISPDISGKSRVASFLGRKTIIHDAPNRTYAILFWVSVDHPLDHPSSASDFCWHYLFARRDLALLFDSRRKYGDCWFFSQIPSNILHWTCRAGKLVTSTPTVDFSRQKNYVSNVTNFAPVRDCNLRGAEEWNREALSPENFVWVGINSDNKASGRQPLLPDVWPSGKESFFTFPIMFSLESSILSVLWSQSILFNNLDQTIVEVRKFPDIYLLWASTIIKWVWRWADANCMCSSNGQEKMIAPSGITPTVE